VAEIQQELINYKCY